MTVTTRGMLGGLFGAQPKLDEEQVNERELLQLAQMAPHQQQAYTQLKAGDQIGKGLGQMFAGATGTDARSPQRKRIDSIEAAKAELAAMNIDPSDTDNYYRQLMAILQKHGLTAELMQVRAEYVAEKQKSREIKVKEDDLQRKTNSDMAKQEAAKERNRIAMLRLDKTGPQIVQLMDAYDKTDEADVYKRQNLMAAIKNLLASSSPNISVVPAGGSIHLVDSKTGEPIREIDVTAKPEDARTAAAREKGEKHDRYAYAEIKAGMQDRLDAIERLHNHPGLPGITGREAGIIGAKGAVGGTATALTSDDTRNAIAVWEQVVGGTFLAGLNKLKAASEKGSTGLGAVSEKEGDKVQADGAALNRWQATPHFQESLRIYAKNILAGGERMDAKATETGVPIIPLRAPAFSTGAAPATQPKDKPWRPAPKKPAAAAPAKRIRFGELPQ